MKKLKLFLLFLLFANGINAEEYSALVVHLHNGSSASFVLAEHPKITFSGKIMNIVSATSSMEFNRDDVKNYLFDNVPTSIDDAVEETDATVSDNTLLIGGVSDNTTVSVYNANGVEVLTSTVVAGSCSVSLHTLPRGLYIVKYNNTTFKFLKK